MDNWKIVFFFISYAKPRKRARAIASNLFQGGFNIVQINHLFSLFIIFNPTFFGCAAEEGWADESCEATAEGFNDENLLEVVIFGGAITEINILGHEETLDFAERVFDEVIPAIIEANYRMLYR